MILSDIFNSEKDLAWDIAKQCGVEYGIIRLREDKEFDLTNEKHWLSLYKKFTDFGIKPLVIEPMPNRVHNHIKAGDGLRDESIEKVLKMFPIMQKLGIESICFNFMAHIGWLRTSNNILERGGARVTGFSLEDFQGETVTITQEELWAKMVYG